MRVTDLMTFQRAQRDGGAASSRLSQATARASTGVRVVHPGDDPGAAALVASERIHRQRLDSVATAAGRASDEVSAVDGSLGEVGTALARASELAVQLSSAPYGASERSAGAKEVQGLLSTVLSALNAKTGDRYVFAGTLDTTRPFDGLALDAAGDVDVVATGAYHGDTGVRQVEIAPGVYQDSSVRADAALRGAAGGVDVIRTLGDLANALAANDPAAVAATVAQLAQGSTQVSNARGQAGAIQGTLDAAVSANQAARDESAKRISSLSDADAIQAASDLALAQHALEASLTATAQSFKFSLLGKL
jgi:flagellar hook-associated protein 3 FlgL